MNALDLIKYSLSAGALIISLVFSIEGLGDKYANCDCSTLSYITFQVLYLSLPLPYLEFQLNLKVVNICL